MNRFVALGVVLSALVLLISPVNAQGNSTTPEQIRLSYPGDGQMTIAWNTMYSTAESVVLFSPKKGGPYTIVTGSAYTFLNTGLEFRTEIIHIVTLTGLKPKTRYYYVCGSRYDKNSLSPEMSFQSLQLAGDTSSLQFAVFGDFGLENARSLPRLINDTAAGLFNMILHVGDIAYNMQDDNGRVGDGFLNAVQPISSTVPYHYCVGNHEQDLLDTFHGFKERFAMPMVDDNENMYYSVDVGPIHFIAFSTEHYFSLEDPFVGLQYEWLINDLVQANKNRAKVPWIIMYGHRPMYCSNVSLEPPKKSTRSDLERQKMFQLQREAEKLFMSDPLNHNLKRDNPPPSQDCSTEAEQIREGFDWFGIRIFGVEKLLYEYGVDLYICGHEHSYERSYPVYNSNVMNGSIAQPYVNPKATVHIVAGSAGCKEGLEYFGPVGMGPWSAFRSATYGYARMKVANSTHMYWEQLLDSTGEVLDQFWLVNYKHGSFGPTTTTTATDPLVA